MTHFNSIAKEILHPIAEWEKILLLASEDIILRRRNAQSRNIKQIIGHMVDSASNNIHRIVHLQYQESPLNFPNYATHGNNDRWITIQAYEHEDWINLVQLWKYMHIHIAHVIANIDTGKLNNKWDAGDKKTVTLEEMVNDFPRHFNLHLQEINDLLNNIK